MFSLSRFQQLMQQLPRGAFDQIVSRSNADKHVKSFGCRSLLISQVFGQVSGCRSLREIETGLNTHAAHHYHLGLRQIRRSTLADALAQRPQEPFIALVELLVQSVGRSVRREARQLLRLLDSTSFTLKGGGYERWTAGNRTSRTQGLKLHVMFHAGQEIPVLQQITAPNVNDVTVGASMPLEPGCTYVFDKGYCDYRWWWKMECQQIRFVTRIKRNARLATLSKRAVDSGDEAIVLADEIVRFDNPNPRAGRKNPYTAPLRKVVIARPDKDTPLELISNDLERPAREIGDLYRERWAIELFFKWIKQNLRIKRFLGTSQNAVRLQILCALITYLLVSLFRIRHRPDQALKQVLDELRTGLFQRQRTEAETARRRRERQAELSARQAVLFA
jgi:IS4 transposase